MTSEEGVAPLCHGLDTHYRDTRLIKKICVPNVNELKGHNRHGVQCIVIIEGI